VLPWDAPRAAGQILAALGLRRPWSYNATLTDQAVNTALARIRASADERAEVRRVLQTVGLLA
jgi:hypothetical protein